MITDKQEMIRHVCSFSCFICKKDLKPSETEHFEISWKQQMKNSMIIDFRYMSSAAGIYETGNGAILRFCNNCWLDIAGEEYTFDPTIWK